MYAADTHVHLYPCFDRDRLFRAAAHRWTGGRAGRELCAGLLCLTGGEDRDAFARLRAEAEAGPGPSGGLRLALTGEPVSLRVDGLGLPLYLVAGRQVVTRERLEVLAVGLADPWPDREEPLDRLVERIARAGGLPIIPWGAGKWWGGRGKVLRAFLARTDRPPVFLGDNSGRPRLWGTPSHVRQARTLGIPVLPGSDPLPIPGEEETAGRCAVFLPGVPDPERPARSLLDALRAGAVQGVQSAGSESPVRFFRNQVRMQCKKGVRR